MGLIKVGWLTKSLPVLLGCILFTGISTFAQGDYLEKGQSGFQAGLNFATSEPGKSIGWDLGYSVDGALDFFFSTSRFSGNSYYHDLNSYAGEVILHVLNSGRYGTLEMPLSLSLGAAYVDEGNDVISSKIYVFSGCVYRNIVASPLVTLQPNFALTYSWGTADQALGDHKFYEVDIDKFTTTMGFSLFHKSSSRFILRLDVGVNIDKDNNINTYFFRVGPMFVTLDKKLK